MYIYYIGMHIYMYIYIYIYIHTYDPFMGESHMHTHEWIISSFLGVFVLSQD